jgi:hypothetical protein
MTTEIHEIVDTAAKDLAQKLSEINPDLLVMLSVGTPERHEDVIVPAGTAQDSWHDAFSQGRTWTDVWGQAPAVQFSGSHQ